MPNTNTAAAPVDYPPAVLKEAEDASRHAFEKAQQVTALEPERRRSYAAAQAANAYAAVLARHTVAVRAQQRLDQQLAPAADGVADFPEVSKADAALARLATVEAAVCACAEIGESERPCIFCEADAIATGTDPTPAILTYDDKTAGRFIVQPSGDGSRVYSFGTTPEQVRPETDEIARLTAERDAWARYARAFVNRTWHGASGTPSSLAAVAELNAACEALRALGIDPGEAAR